MFRKITLSTCLLLFLSTVFSQSPIDSLQRELANTGEDTNRVKILLELVNMLGPGPEGMQLNDQLGNLAKNLKENPDEDIADMAKVSYAHYLGNVGYVASMQGDYKTALMSYFESLPILIDQSEMEGLTSVMNNIGQAYEGLGDIPEALKYYKSSLLISEK